MPCTVIAYVVMEYVVPGGLDYSEFAYILVFRWMKKLHAAKTRRKVSIRPGYLGPCVWTCVWTCV